MLRRANGDRRRWHRSLVGAFGLYVVRASPRSLGVARNRIAKMQLYAHTILCVLQSYESNSIVGIDTGHKAPYARCHPHPAGSAWSTKPRLTQVEHLH